MTKLKLPQQEDVFFLGMMTTKINTMYVKHIFLHIWKYCALIIVEATNTAGALQLLPVPGLRKNK